MSTLGHFVFVVMIWFFLGVITIWGNIMTGLTIQAITRKIRGLNWENEMISGRLWARVISSILFLPWTFSMFGIIAQYYFDWKIIFSTIQFVGISFCSVVLITIVLWLAEPDTFVYGGGGDDDDGGCKMFYRGLGTSEDYERAQEKDYPSSPNDE